MFSFWATVLFVATQIQPLDAYIDPGSGSLFLQALFGGIAGIAVVARLCWTGLRRRLGLTVRPPHDERAR